VAFPHPTPLMSSSHSTPCCFWSTRLLHLRLSAAVSIVQCQRRDVDVVRECNNSRHSTLESRCMARPTTTHNDQLVFESCALIDVLQATGGPGRGAVAPGWSKAFFSGKSLNFYGSSQQPKNNNFVVFSNEQNGRNFIPSSENCWVG